MRIHGFPLPRDSAWFAVLVCVRHSFTSNSTPHLHARLSPSRPSRPPRSPCQNELTMTSRFIWALGVYAVLAMMAALTLDGNLRAAVWILLAGLTVKTCIAYKAGW